MTIVRKIDGAWEPLRGTVTLTEMATTATMHYRGARPDETVTVEPYEVETAPMDAGKIEKLVADGIWGEDELTRYGLKVAEPFVVPEGKQKVGAASYVEKKGIVSEVYEVEDIPPPPPPPTAEEKLANAGLSEAEFDGLIAKSLARQKART